MKREKVTVKILAPFPPCRNKWGQVFRPVLCFLGVWREDEYEIELKEMSAEALYVYYEQMMDSLSVLQQYADFNADFMRIFQNSIMRAHEVAKISPQVFALATGIDDHEWFRSLPPSQIHDLEEAIERANPSIQEAKKNLMALAKKVEEELERQPLGSKCLTSSVNDGAQPLTH